MHKLLSRTFALLALVAVLPAAAFASTSRVAGMNVPGDYIKDYTGIRTYVSGVSSVGNLIWVNPSDDQGMGAVLQNLFDGRFGSFAVNINNDAQAMGSLDPNFTAGESVDLTWGRKMGSGSFGVRVNRSYSSLETAAGTTEGLYGRNIMGFGAGYGWALNSNTDVELSALYQTRSFKTATATEHGGTAYQLAGRAMTKAGSNLSLTTAVKISSYDMSTETVPAGVVTTDKTTGWSAGLAGNWTLGSNDLFVFGAEFNNAKNDNGTAQQKASLMPAVFMGLETGVNSWLTLRFGASNSITARGENFAGDVLKTDTFSFSTGAGVKVGTLQFDATVAPSFYNGAVNNVLNGTPFANVSATYTF